MNCFNFIVLLLAATCFTSSYAGLVNKVLQSMTGGMYGPGYNQNHGLVNGHHGMNGPIPVGPHPNAFGPMGGPMIGHMGGPVGGHIGGPIGSHMAGPIGGHIGGPIAGHMGGPIGGHINGPIVGPLGPNLHSGGKPEPKFPSAGRDYYGFRNPRIQG